MTHSYFSLALCEQRPRLFRRTLHREAQVLPSQTIRTGQAETIQTGGDVSGSLGEEPSPRSGGCDSDNGGRLALGSIESGGAAPETGQYSEAASAARSALSSSQQPQDVEDAARFPHSPTAIPWPDVDGDRLSWELSLAMIDRGNDERSRFLPSDKLDELICPDTVRRELLLKTDLRGIRLSQTVHNICGIGLVHNHQRNRLVEAPKVSFRRRIFAILVMLDQVDRISQFIAEGLWDTDLPLELRSPLKSGSMTRPRLAVRRSAESQLKCLDNWPAVLAESFAHYQWRVLAPFFGIGKQPENKIKHYQLDPCVVLPFYEDDSQKDVLYGGFGEVWKVKIHPAHHDYSDQSKVIPTHAW